MPVQTRKMKGEDEQLKRLRTDIDEHSRKIDRCNQKLDALRRRMDGLQFGDSHGLWSAYNKKLNAISLKVDRIWDTLEHIDYTSDDSNVRFDLAIYKDIESVRDKYWAIRRSLRHACQDLLDCKPISGERPGSSESPQPIYWPEDLTIQDEDELHEDQLYIRSVRDYFSDEDEFHGDSPDTESVRDNSGDEDESHGDSPDTESVRDNSGDEEESYSDWISRAFSSLHIGRPSKSLHSSPTESKTTNSSASGIWKSKEQIGPKNLERIRTCLLQITKYAERGQLYAIDCEFCPSGLPYAPIPSEIAVVDVVSVETTKPKREHVKFDYRLTAEDFQRQIDLAHATTSQGDDDASMKSWLSTLDKQHRPGNMRRNLNDGLTPVEMRKLFVKNLNMKDDMLLIKWGQTDADISSFARIWGSNNGFLIIKNDQLLENFNKIDLAHLIKMTTNLEGLILKGVFETMYPDEKGLKYHDALVDATVTARICLQLYKNRHRWL